MAKVLWQEGVGLIQGVEGRSTRLREQGEGAGCVRRTEVRQIHYDHYLA